MPSIFFKLFSPGTNLRQATARREASTYYRLQVSRHLADRRLILSLTAVIAGLVMLSAFLFAVEREVTNNWTEVRGNHGWVWLRVPFSSIVNFPSYAGAVLSGVVALAASVFAWIYQTGRTRLGVIDLIAAEIIAICNTPFALDRLERYIVDHDFHRHREIAGNGALVAQKKAGSRRCQDRIMWTSC
jgi:hypothetical protein